LDIRRKVSHLSRERGLMCAVIFCLGSMVLAGPVQGDVNGSPRLIEEVRTNKPGVWSIGGGLRYEAGRELTDSNHEYDNVRLHDVGARWGLTDSLEMGAAFSYSSNSAASNTPDRSGLEGTALYAKVPWHEFLATTVRFNFGGSSDVYPYGSEDVDMGVNVPFRFPFARGMLHGELGMTFQSGDAMGLDGTSGTPGWDDYVNYGVGYVYDVHRLASMSVEIAGHTSTVTGGGASFNDHLELNIGGQLHLSPKTRISPGIGFGLLGGSPNVALGVGFETEFGEPYRERETMDNPLPRERYARLPDQQEREEPAAPAEPTEEMTRDRGPIETGEAPMDRLIRQGRSAFERGNLQRAIQKFNEAAQYSPANLIIQSNLGSLYFRTRQYEEARVHYRKAVEIDPNDVFSHLYLGLTYYRLGEYSLSRRYLRRVLQLDPDNQRAQEWLNRMDQES
jgi:hypothetical protein